MKENSRDPGNSSTRNSPLRKFNSSFTSREIEDIKFLLFDSIKKCDILTLDEILNMDEVETWNFEDEEKMTSMIL